MSHAYWSQFSPSYLRDLQGIDDQVDDHCDDQFDDQDEPIPDHRSYQTRMMDELGLTWRDFV